MFLEKRLAVEECLDTEAQKRLPTGILAPLLSPPIKGRMTDSLFKLRALITTLIRHDIPRRDCDQVMAQFTYASITNLNTQIAKLLRRIHHLIQIYYNYYQLKGDHLDILYCDALCITRYAGELYALAQSLIPYCHRIQYLLCRSDACVDLLCEDGHYIDIRIAQGFANLERTRNLPLGAGLEENKAAMLSLVSISSHWAHHKIMWIYGIMHACGIQYYEDLPSVMHERLWASLGRHCSSWMMYNLAVTPISQCMSLLLEGCEIRQDIRLLVMLAANGGLPDITTAITVITLPTLSSLTLYHPTEAEMRGFPIE